MIFYLAILLIQILCIVDVVRHGRNQLWIMALVFLPGPSTIAYLIVEVLPGYGGHRTVRAARARVGAALDPEREVRSGREALATADTIANRVRLADALGALGRWDEALALYREAAARGGTALSAPAAA